MLRPIEADGTCRYSTGRPGRENAPAVAVPPARLIRPGRVTAAAAPTNSRRLQARIFSLTSVIPAPCRVFVGCPRQNLPCEYVKCRLGREVISVSYRLAPVN